MIFFGKVLSQVQIPTYYARILEILLSRYYTYEV